MHGHRFNTSTFARTSGYVQNGWPRLQALGQLATAQSPSTSQLPAGSDSNGFFSGPHAIKPNSTSTWLRMLAVYASASRPTPQNR